MNNKLFENRPVSSYIYNTIGGGAKFWEKGWVKKILEILRIIVLIICTLFLAWVAYYAFLGFGEAEPSEDYEVTYPY